MFSPLTFGLSFAAIGTAVLAVFWGLRYSRHARLRKSLDMRLLLVRLPAIRESKEGKKDALSEIAFSSQLFSLLAKAAAPVVFEIAVHHVGEEVAFYVAVPEKVLEFASKQIQGLWPSALVERAPDDYSIFNPQGDVAAAVVRLKRNFALPIRTYVEAQLDTFAPLLGNFSKINAVGEGIAMQILLRPAPIGTKGKIARFIYQLKQGKKLEEVIEKKFSLPSLTPDIKKKEEEKKPKAIVVDEDAVKALEQKTAKPLFEVNIRLVASAPTPYRANELLDGIAGSFDQFSAPLRNELHASKLRDAKKLLYKFIFREFDSDEALVLGADEVASIFHFPTSDTAMTRLMSVRSAEAPPPIDMPKGGTLMGESSYRGEGRPVYITDEDRRRHVYVIGQTGTGKSNLLVNMVRADIEAGKGVSVIDPHGDLIDSILRTIPAERRSDVIVFDPADRLAPLGLNMLEYDVNYPEQKTFIVNEMQGIFNKLFSQETMGPMFEQYMRNALLLLMEDSENEPATLMEVPRVFTDIEFRKRKLARILNPTVVDFWEKEAVKAGGEASLANITPYITSKFNNFIANDYVRPIIGQTKSAFNFRKVMDEGKILLVNLSKGRIGDINAGLLGMVIVGKLLMASLSRVDVPEAKRRDFYLYIDEFQNFTTESIATILSEARKYRLDLVVAHQFIKQLQEKIRDAVFGNVGSQIAFRVGAEDAEFLVKQFEPVFTKNDLINIDNFNAYAKLLINGKTTPPFNIRTLKADFGDARLPDTLKAESRQKYGANRREVEGDILKRLRT